MTRKQQGIWLLCMRARYYPIYRDIIEQSRKRREELTADELAKRIYGEFEKIGLVIHPNATRTTVNTRKRVDLRLDPLIDKMHRGYAYKERDIYGPSLMEYIKEVHGGIRRDSKRFCGNSQTDHLGVNQNGIATNETRQDKSHH